jgi:hypothetical protein
MSSTYCFQCSREYVEDVTACVECGVPLVENEPTPIEEVGGPEDPQVAYEMHEWTFESRATADRLLTEAGIVHGWQGAVLVVLEEDEERVDALVEEAEAAEGPALAPDVDKIGYDMDDWSPEARDTLVSALALAGVAHMFDEDGELVVAETDEEQVDDLIEALTERLALEDELGEATTSMEGLPLNDFLGDVRGLAQKLMRNPGDAKATLAIVGKARDLADIRTPFGFDSRRWAAIRKGGMDMASVLSDEERSEEDVTSAATTLRGLLENVV